MVSVLEAKDVRIDVAGVPAIDGLSLTSTGSRVLVLGAARALFEAAGGVRATRRGDLRVEGVAPLNAVRSGLVAAAPLDPPMPSSWTPLQYVSWSARLAGHGRAAARSMADEALSRMQVSPPAKTKVGNVSTSVRRATVVAAALATGATTLLIEDPFVGLADDAARPFARAIALAVEDRRTAFFAARAALDSPLVLAADEVIVIDRSSAVAQGAPAEVAARGSTFALRVGGNVRAFTDTLSAEGGRLLAPVGGTDASRVTVDLGGLRTRDLLRIAATSNAVVLELHPIARAFAWNWN